MEVLKVQEIRAMAEKYNKIIKIVADNSHIFYTGEVEYQHLIWDDEGGCIYMFRLPENSYATKGGPSTVELVITDYDCIQNMIIQPSFSDLQGILTDLGEDAGKIPEIIKRFQGPYANAYLNKTQK